MTEVLGTPHPLHQQAFDREQEEPKRGDVGHPTIVTPFQNEIIKVMLAPGNEVLDSKAIGKALGRRSQAIGASLQHLETYGLARFLSKGLWEILPAARNVVVGKPDGRGKTKPKAKKEIGSSRSAVGTPAAGDLFELVGSTAQGKLLVRSIEGHIVYAITEV